VKLKRDNVERGNEGIYVGREKEENMKKRKGEI
jgi:hypothetical protein